MLEQISHIAPSVGRVVVYTLLAVSSSFQKCQDKINLLTTEQALIGLFLKGLYNVSPIHPLAKYPGPFLWRLSRLPASYHHARGDLYQHIAVIHEKYGPTVRIAPDELIFTAPEAWPQIYNSRPQLQKSRWHFAGGDDPKGFKESMITAPDAEHMRLRRLANPAFLTSGILEQEPVMQEYTELLCKQLAEASTEGSQNMVEWLLWALNDVIGHLALDQRFECLQKRRMHPWPSFLLGALKASAAINQFRRFGVPLKALQLLMTQKMRNQSEDFVRTATIAMDERLAKEEQGGKEGKADIVGLMLRELKGEKLSKADITTNSVLIVGGGAETTSTCLSATIYHLCKTPRVMEKLKAEVRKTFASSDEITLRATAEMPYVKATIDESLRIFPVASYITPRMTPKEGHVINGEMVPGNVSLPRT